MAQQINATMSTKIALDLLSASESVKSLTAVVRSSQNAWKAQEAEMKSAGDAVGAAQAKYDGLGKSIEAQQSKIDALKAKQAELKGNTADVAQQFLKYQQQIDGATKQLASMQAQQDRAKQAMDYQKSGLAGLKQEYTAAARANQAYVTRLEAEGKQQEANKAKMEGYKSSIANLNEQLAKQSAELDKIASASGKDSDAWRTQKTRVDETATSLAKAKSSMTGLQAEMDKANPSVFNRVKEAISGTNKQAEKTPGLLRKIVEGGLITNAITNGWQALKGKIEEATAAGMQYEKQQDQMNAIWLTLTGNAEKGQAMVDMTNKLAVKFGQDTDLVNELNQQFYHVFDNQPKTEALTSAFLTMGDAIGLSSDRIQQVGLDFTHTLSGSIVQLGDFNQLTDAFPMMADAMLEYEKKVQHNSQLTMTDLRAQMSAGKISAQDATNVIEELGQKYSKASENLMQTIPGMTRVIKSRIPALIGDIEKPFLTAQNPVLGAISRWSQDKNTDKEFGKLGQAMSKGLSTITTAFAKAFDLSAGPKAMDKMMDKLSDAVTKVSQSIASHAGQIKTFFTTISTTGSAMAKISWVALTSGLKVLNPLLKSLGDFADKHPKLFGDLAAGFIALNLAGKALPIAAIAGFTKTIGGMYSGLKNLANSKFADMIKTNLSKLNSSALGKGMATITIAYDAISDIKDLTKAFSKGGTVGQKFSAVGESAGTLIGGGIGAFFGGPLGAAVGATIGKTAGKWAGDAAKKFTDGWNAKKKPANSWLGGLGWDARQMTNNVVKWWDGINKSTDAAQKKQHKQQEAANKRARKEWNDFWKGVGKGWNGFLKTVNGWGKSLSTAWSKVWNPISKTMSSIWKNIVKIAKAGLDILKKVIVYPAAFIAGLFILAWRKVEKPFKDVWNGLVKFVKPPLNTISKNISSTTKGVQNAWNKTWGAISKFFSNTWNSIVKIVSSSTNWIVKNVTNFLNAVKKVWGSIWKAISNFFKDIWNDIVKIYNNVSNTLSKGISVTLKFIQNVWNTAWGAISGFFGNIWNGMVKFFTPIIHGMSNTIGSVIKSIKNVWTDVWGGVGSFFSGIWDGIKKAAESGINFVVRVIRTGLSAVNGVLGFFGVKKVGLPSYVHFAQGGEVGKDGTQLAMVNDDGSEHYKELIHKKRTNQWIYAEKRNAILPLETGDRVYNGRESKAIANMYGIPGFAQGGIIGSVWDGVKDASSWVVDKAEDVGKWIGDKFEAIVDWIAHPVKHVTDLISSSIKGIVSSSPVKAFGDLGVGIFKHAYNGIGNWIKKELKKIEDSMANPGGSGVQRWKPYVIQALKANGFDASAYQVAAWMRVIQRESNGNPRAINLWDSNAKAGIPSMGLVQTIGPTFNAFKFPGHNDVYNGYDDLLAGIHYMKAIYGSGSSAFARVSGPEGYANGGLIKRPIHALVGEDGPETILPLTKTSRAWQLLGQAVTNINHNLGNGSVAESESSSTDDLGKKLDNIADLLTKLSFVLQVGDDQFYPKVAPKVKQYNDRTDRFNAYWKGGTV
ncbi:putative tape measure protein [Lactobacillus phage Lc-Nu]|uniref:Tape measure protein n=2 Tax=Lactobacillus phage Lc-Nu TaxID=146269 RepID=A8YQJ9_9CAUD|nr:minor tail protein [Lactobacillus phage Lc-Nu]AAM68914.3 putative tape measure protein [Lactobacillus phage Lc-Nu]